VEVVKGAVEAFERGSFDEALAAFAPDVVYEVLPSTGPEPGVHHGHHGMRRAFGDWMASWDEYEAGVHEVIEAGEHVVVVGWDRGRAKGSGALVERDEIAFVYRVNGDRIARAWMCADKAEAIRTVERLRT
jgi:ketosteroid isomerase-like protein